MKNSKQIYIEMEAPQDLKGRPIIAGPEAPTQHLSALVEKIISPLVPKLQSYIKDDWDFQRKLPKTLKYSATLYSYDIVSLYTNITHDLGLKALEYYIDKYGDIISRFTKEFMIKSADFILNNNNFLFDNILYHQLKGTAMGTIMLPLDPNIRSTLEKAKNSKENNSFVQILNFLDISILLYENEEIQTDIFLQRNELARLFTLGKPPPTAHKSNIPYNLAKRIIFFCTNYEKEQQRLNELNKWLINCGYAIKIIDKNFITLDDKDQLTNLHVMTRKSHLFLLSIGIFVREL